MTFETPRLCARSSASSSTAVRGMTSTTRLSVVFSLRLNPLTARLPRQLRRGRLLSAPRGRISASRPTARLPRQRRRGRLLPAPRGRMSARPRPRPRRRFETREGGDRDESGVARAARRTNEAPMTGSEGMLQNVTGRGSAATRTATRAQTLRACADRRLCIRWPPSASGTCSRLGAA